MEKHRYTTLTTFIETAQLIKDWRDSQERKSGVAATIDYLIKLGIKHASTNDNGTTNNVAGTN